MTLGYRVEADGVAVVYLVDHEPFSDELWRAGAEPGRIESILHEGDRRHARFMADADLVIHDAQYTPEEYRPKKTWGHSTYEYVVRLAAAAGVRRVALTHHDPGHDERSSRRSRRRARGYAEQLGYAGRVCCAYEGLELAVEPRIAVRQLGQGWHRLWRPHRRSGCRILVVDDDPDLPCRSVKALSQDGHIVSEAFQRPGGPRGQRAQAPDLLVLDLLMPKQGGPGGAPGAAFPVGDGGSCQSSC